MGGDGRGRGGDGAGLCKSVQQIIGRDGFGWFFFIPCLGQLPLSCQKRFGLYISFSLWDVFLFHLPSFLSSSIGLLGLLESAAVVAHVPDCFLGQTSRSWVKKPRKKKEKRWKGKIWWGEREGEGEDPLALQSLFNYSNGRCPSALVLSTWFEY